MLKAIGKYIDTMPIQQLLSQEEARADTITIEVDRFYGAHDLSEFIFMMRGITESGGEAEAFLRKQVGDNIIRLEWDVAPAFTKESGTLALDLFAYRYEEGWSDKQKDPPDYLLRYQLPAVQVRGLPDGTHVLDEKSYTAFLLLIRETAQQVIEDISGASSEVWKELNRMDSVVTFNNISVKACLTQIQEFESRIQAMEQDFVPIVILTESGYATLSEKDPKTLYVVKADVVEENAGS